MEETEGLETPKLVFGRTFSNIVQSSGSLWGSIFVKKLRFRIGKVDFCNVQKVRSSEFLGSFQH